METARNDNKRKASVISEDDNADFLIDNLKFEPSFLQDDLLDIPNLGPDSILTLDSASDAFPDLNLFSDGTGAGCANAGAAQTHLEGLEGLFASDDELEDFFPGGSGTGFNKMSPSTSESGNINEGRAAGLPIATAPAMNMTETASEHNNNNISGGSGGAASNPSSSIAQEDEAKKLARMQRNRENAYLSRQRKKHQMAELQQTCTQLRGQTTQLTCLVHRLVAENCLLRHHLGAACQKAGMPVPDVPSAMKATAAAAARAPAAAPGVVAPPPVMMTQQQQQGVMPLIPGMVPMVAKQEPRVMPAAAPAVATAVPQQNKVPTATAAPAAGPVAPAAPDTTASGRPVRTKRARVTGAGAAFLTLFSIFLFVGPMAPLTGRTTTSSSFSGSSAVAAAGYLPPAGGLLADHSSQQQLLGPITRSHAGARSLLQSVSIEDSSSTDPASTLPTLSPSLVQQTVDALLQDSHSQQLPAQALQRLQDLAPAAVVLDPNDNLNNDDSATSHTRSTGTIQGSGNPLAASTAFPVLANSFFKAAGLDAPQTCQKVFEFDASTLPHPARSRRSVERFITGAYGFKGRSVGLPHITATATGTAGTGSLTTSHTRSTTLPLRLPSSAAVAAANSNGDATLVVKALENERRLHELHELPSSSAAGDGTMDGDDIVLDGSGKESTDLLPIAVNEPTLVSVLLPSNASQPGEGGLTAVDRVFVVLLHPGERFITYSCGLSRPLLV